MSTEESTPSAVRSRVSDGSATPAGTLLLARPASQATSTTGEDSSQGIESSSWMTELVMIDSEVVPG